MKIDHDPHASATPDDPPYLILGPHRAGAAAALPGPELIGFKAYNLARMAASGLPVPPAFVLSTRWCSRAQALTQQVWRPALEELQRATGLRLGDPRRPLLVSVRSGAPVSMPGMLETLLDIGLNDETVQGLIRLTGNPRLAWDAYRRLVAGYGEIVLGLPAAAFEADVQTLCEAGEERALDFSQLRALAQRHLATVQTLSGKPFPQDPHEQLQTAIRAVHASWNADKAVAWRRLKDIPDTLGTAVTVQRMVFGNAGGRSGAGVGFTRNPATGQAEPWVDFLFNAQGEDVVSGRRTAPGHEELERVAPSVWAALTAATTVLERTCRDMQDFEFTVEEGRLYLLQTRDGKRTPQAAARIALDLHEGGLITRAEALARTDALDTQTLAQTRLAFETDAAAPALGEAQSACTGVVSGEIALDEDRVQSCRARGQDALLVRPDAQTSDLPALEQACGLLTRRGSRTSHAAVVARQLGKVCLVGCEALRLDLERRRIDLGGRSFEEGEVLTLDGNTGRIYAGRGHVVREVPPDIAARLAVLRGAAVATTPAAGATS